MPRRRNTHTHVTVRPAPFRPVVYELECRIYPGDMFGLSGTALWGLNLSRAGTNPWAANTAIVGRYRPALALRAGHGEARREASAAILVAAASRRPTARHQTQADGDAAGHRISPGSADDLLEFGSLLDGAGSLPELAAPRPLTGSPLGNDADGGRGAGSELESGARGSVAPGSPGLDALGSSSQVVTAAAKPGDSDFLPRPITVNPTPLSPGTLGSNKVPVVHPARVTPIPVAPAQPSVVPVHGPENVERVQSLENGDSPPPPGNPPPNQIDPDDPDGDGDEGDYPTIIAPSSSDHSICSCRQPVQENPNVASLSSDSGTSEAPVRYFDGTVQLESVDLSSDSLGRGWGLTRSWTNTLTYMPEGPGYYLPGVNGRGMVTEQMPYVLTIDASSVSVVLSGTNALFFDNVNTTHPTGQFFIQDKLTHSGGEYVLDDTTGDELHFFDAGAGVRAGKFKGMTDPFGNVTTVTSWTAAGNPAEVQRMSAPGQTPPITESYLYSYVPSGVNQDLMAHVILRRQVSGGGWVVVRQVDYTYYNTGEAYGNPQDLKTATVQDPAGNPLDTTYYRYYLRTGPANQLFDGLKYVFNPQSYARLVAAVGDPTQASDDQVASYADNFFAYDDQDRVITEVAQDAGSSTTNGGLGTFTFTYLDHGIGTDYNSWSTKTIETLPDNSPAFVSRNIVYCNSYGEVMLKVYESGTPGNTQKWATFYKFDNAGRAVLQANPSAVTGFDESKPDLLNNAGGHYQYLSDNQGELTITDYYTTTTATETTAGGVAGYYQDTKLQHGQRGTPILQKSQQYYAHTAKTFHVAVFTPGGISTYSPADQYTYATPLPPVVSGLNRTSGTILGGDHIVLFGAGFTGATAVTFGTSAATFTVLSDTALSVAVPAHAVGAVDVTVTTAAGTSAVVAADRYSYVLPAAPTVTGLSQSSGSVLGTNALVIFGTGFTAASRVSFGTMAVFPTVLSDTALSVTVPAHAGGAVDVTVTTPGGTSAASAADQYTYVVPPAPVVSGLNQTSGTTLGGYNIVISGGGFTGATKVSVGVANANFSLVSDMAISVTIPARTAAGVVDVTVTGPGGTSAVTAADRFSYVLPPAPAVTGLNLTSGTILGGYNAVVFGSGFTAASKVFFGTSAVTPTVLSDTSISLTVPAHAAGAVDVTVQGPGGTSAITAADRFTFSRAPTPVVAGLNQTSGTSLGGDHIAVFGMGFTGASKVNFGATSATFSVLSDTLLSVTVPAHTGTGTVDVTVTTPGGTSAVVAADRYSYGLPPAPTVSGVSPTSGPAAGGYNVIIIGTGFTGATRVAFGGTASASITDNSATLITARVPQHAAGTVDVTVTNPGGTSATSTADQFTYVAPPTPAVTGLNQTTGNTLGAYNVVIFGSGFTGATKVSFGTTAATPSVLSDTAIGVTVPAHAAGVVDVTVQGPGGTSSITTADRFTYVLPPAPVVSGLNLTSGTTLGSYNAVIQGTGFTAASKVFFGTTAVVPTVLSDTALSVTVPAHAASTVDVTVQGPGGTSAITAVDQFTYVLPAAPTVSDISLTSGSTLGGYTMTVIGTGFVGTLAVSFGGTAGTAVSATSPEVLTVRVPAHAAGTVDVTVTNPGGTSATSVADQFTFAVPPVPAVSGLNVTSGSTLGTYDAVISGSGFTGTSRVFFGTTAASFTVLSDSALNVTVPAHTAATVDVTVTTPGGTSATSPADQFTYILPPAPTVTGLNLTSGTTLGSDNAVIYGSGFTAATRVLFGTTAAALRFLSDTAITVTVPAHAAGTVDVTVTGPGGTSATTSADQFTYVRPVTPALTGISPATGTTLGGSSITIIGTGFFGTPSVSFGGTAGSVTSIAANTLTVRAPAHTAGTVDVTVTTQGGTSAITSADQFTYVVPTRPAVSGLNVTSGSTLGTYNATIAGVGFTGVTRVLFGTTAAAFRFLSDTAITVTVPAHAAGTVDVTVVTPAGTSATSTADQFTYILPPAPTVTGLNLTSGVTRGTYNLVIAGTGFTGASRVFFSTTAAAFTFLSDTALSVTVPAHPAAGVVDVTVQGPGGTSATSAADQFTYVLPPAPAVTGVGPASGLVAGGYNVTIIGTDFLGATAVAFGGTAATSFTVNWANVITAKVPAHAAGTVDVTVTTPGGTSATSTADQFTYVTQQGMDGPTPVVTGLGPTFGPSAGGYYIAIIGTSFTGATRVAFGTVNGTIAGVTANVLSVRVPAHAAGTVDVTVTTPKGTSMTSTADRFTFVAPPVPVVTGLNLTSGSTLGTYDAVIYGSGFASTARVAFGTIATSFNILSDSALNVAVPAHAAATVDVTVTTAGGTSATSSADRFTYILPAVPTVSGLNLTAGTTLGNDNAVIAGTGFTGATKVFFGTTSASFLFLSDTALSVTVPAHAAGVVDVTVQGPGGTSATSAADRFTYRLPPPPTVSGIGPTTGSTLGGYYVTILGSNFAGVSRVAFGGTASTYVYAISATALGAYVPAHAAGTVDVTVTTPGGTSATSTADQFNYLPVPRPVVTSFNRNSGSTLGSYNAVITGTGFTGITRVLFGSTAASFLFLSDTAISVTVPAHAAAGTVDVTVTTPGGTSAVAMADQFTYILPPAPTVTGLNLVSGTVLGSYNLVITGTGFTGASKVFFGTIGVNPTILSDVAVSVTVPAQAAGTVDVTVQGPGGTSATSMADQFSYVLPAAPVVTGVSLTSGSTLGGPTITILGTDLLGTTVVSFGSASVAPVSVTANIVTARVPAHAAGMIDVTVTTPGGTSAADQFTYVPAALPVVSGLNLTSGNIAGTYNLVISGSGFTGASRVFFGTTAATFAFLSDTALSVRVPAHVAGTVDVTIVTPAGTSATTMADQFTYRLPAVPTVAGFNVTSGTTLGGYNIVLRGTGLTATSSVLFGTTSASFTFLSDTALSVTVPAHAAGIVDVTVTTPGGTSGTSAADQFTYRLPAPPTVSGVSPANGSTLGGYYVTIIGTGFTGVTRVAFGSTASTYFYVASATVLSVLVPAGASGMADVTVTTSGGTSSISAADHFTYVTPPVPVVTGLSQVSGSGLGGYTLVVEGTGFTGASRVLFGTTYTPFTFLSDTALSVTVPAHANGMVDVTVTTPGGTSATSSADRFNYAIPVSVVTGLGQATGSGLGGYNVVIQGTGFSGTRAVYFGTQSAYFSVLSDTAISATVPAHAAAGVADVTVTTPGGTSAISGADQFTYIAVPVPTVSGLTLTSGLGLGGYALVIQGTGFTAATQVLFGTQSVYYPTVLSDTAIRVAVPAHAAGVVDVKVITPGGISAASAADQFTYGFPVPIVTALSQASGTVLGGTVVIVSGSGFLGATKVSFGGTALSAIRVISDSLISVTAPTTSAGGAVDVTVTTPGGTSATSAADQFTYVLPPVPTVTSLGLNNGTVLGGAVVVVLGTGFTGATQVSFGTVAAASIRAISDNALSVTAPAQAAGAVDVTVTTPGGTSATTAADQFTYVLPAAPTVTSVGLNAGPGAGGYTVTVIGTGFTAASTVALGGTPATAFTVVSDNTIRATVPAGAAGTVDVTVSTPGGTSATTAADQFTYLGPTVTDVGPFEGLVAGGTNVTIIGGGFTGATAVSFGGTPATSFTVKSDAVITAVAPAGMAGVVDITVTTPGGTSAASTGDQFTYVTQLDMEGPVPVVTGVGTAAGNGAGGYSVTILGTGFTGATAVLFGGTAATSFTVVSSDVITATVPAQAAATVDVTVTTPGGTSAASAADQFTYLGPTVTGLGLTAGTVLGGESVTIVGSGFTGATAVTFGGVAARFTINSDGSITATAPLHLLQTIYPVANETVYRNPDGTGAETTSYSYTWYDISNAMQSQTVTHAVVSAAQNGPGTPDVETTVYDIYGRVIWTKDGGGFIRYTEYDPATGAVDKTITDVDTTRTSDFQNLPAGWVTPPGGGLHLETQIGVDALGREIQRVDPNGNITYTVYDDPNHEVRVYPGWNAATGTPTGPTQVYREDRANSPSYMESLTMSAGPNVDVNGVPDGSEPISQVQSLTRTFTSPGGQVIETDAYVSLAGLDYAPDPYIGTAGVNYYPTYHDYDAQGRQNRVISPTGTIYRTVYDGLGRVVSAWVGTSDTPADGADWTPDDNTPPANMVQTAAHVYDNGGVGDSNLTQVTQFPGGGALPRVTQYFYDWRDRQVEIKAGVQASENDGTHRPIVYRQYDNLNDVVANEVYDGDGITPTITTGVPDRPPANRLRIKTTTQYDDRGRIYQTNRFSVDQTNGTVSASSLTTGTWYDHRGNTLKTSNPGGLVTKSQYNGAGMLVTSYETDGLGDSTWADASSVANNNVLSQTDTQYDVGGNPIFVVQRERFHDETRHGPLGDANAMNLAKARASYVASYYDTVNRLTDQVDVGTNGGTLYIRPDTVPTGSNTVLVTHTDYDAAGQVLDTIDPRGIVTLNTYDMLGRVAQTIEDYTDGTPTDNSNRTTAYTYDGADHVLTQTAVLSNSVTQTTQFVYGVTGSINSNDLLAMVIFPDNGLNLVESYTYDALGELTTKTDRNGTTHAFTYDVLGRLTVDAVTALGQGVDGSVLRLETAYDTGGRAYLYTSYDAASGGNVVNQVEQTYNGLGQLITEYQSHAGPVDPTMTPNVQYAYSEMAGGANHSRLVSMTYPNGRVIHYNYAAGVDSAISRLSSISDSSATLEAYTYLGLATVVKRSHPQPGVDLTYIKQAGEQNGDAGDPYTGLDRFGQVVDQRWIHSADGTATDRFQYGYDTDGNALYCDNLVNRAFGELYQANGAGYDGLNRLSDFSRGTLNATHDGLVGSASRSQDWTLDALGNWQSVTSDGVTETRDHNIQNQIVDVNGTLLGYDNNGNTSVDQNGNTLVYDAWNRLVAAQDINGNPLSAYSYDALGRRITESSAASLDLYFSTSWQVLEEQSGGAMQAQYVWSPVYLDALVERDGNDGSRLYVQQDANWSVTAVISTSGAVQERYIYDPYGAISVLAPDWSGRGASSVNWIYYHQGGRYDSASGLYQFRRRDYSPTLGRWLQQDPEGYAGGGNNLYNYLRSSPDSGVDPFGRAEKRKEQEDPVHNAVENASKVNETFKATAETAEKLTEHNIKDITRPGELKLAVEQRLSQENIAHKAALIGLILQAVDTVKQEFDIAKGKTCEERGEAFSKLVGSQASFAAGLAAGEGVAAVAGIAGAETGPADIIIAGGAGLFAGWDASNVTEILYKKYVKKIVAEYGKQLCMAAQAKRKSPHGCDNH